MSIGERTPTFLSVKKFLFFEQLKVFKRFYTKKLFYLDLLYFFSYLFVNPFRMAKKRGSIYGETPLSELEKIARYLGLQKGKTFLELGCGRGRGLLFLSERYAINAIGIDWVKGFIKRATHIQKFLHIKAEFLYDAIKNAPFERADAVYFYGTSFSDEEAKEVTIQMRRLKKGAKIVSVSYPVSDFDRDSFALEKTFTLSFPWGKTDGFLQRKR